MPKRTSIGLHYQYVINNNQFEIYLITWWNPAHKTSRRKKEINTEYCIDTIRIDSKWGFHLVGISFTTQSYCYDMFLETKLLVLWQYNFLFSTSTSHRQHICQILKEKCSTSTLFFFQFQFTKELIYLHYWVQISSEMLQKSLANPTTVYYVLYHSFISNLWHHHPLAPLLTLFPVLLC